MLFTQFVDDDLGCGSYLIGDEHAGIAVVVDPAYAIERYLEECERRGVRLVGVLETHTHADHVSGHGRLALEHGLPVWVHEAADAAYPHEPLVDGTEIELGEVLVRTSTSPSAISVPSTSGSCGKAASAASCTRTGSPCSSARRPCPETWSA